MANYTRNWSGDDAYDDYVNLRDADGKPLTIKAIAEIHKPDTQTIESFRRGLARFAKRHDWDKRRDAHFQEHGSFAKPATPDAPEPTPGVPLGTHLSQDGLTCPVCNASLAMEDDSIARTGQALRDLRGIIETQITSAADDVSAQMLGQLSTSMERLLKMQEKQQQAILAKKAQHSTNTMTTAEAGEFDRVTQVFFGLIARAPAKQREKTRKQLLNMVPLPGADDASVVNLEHQHGDDA